VRCYGKCRGEVYRRAVQIRTKRFGIICTGKMPRDTAMRAAGFLHPPLIGNPGEIPPGFEPKD
jgi:hypothetical protein